MPLWRALGSIGSLSLTSWRRAWSLIKGSFIPPRTIRELRDLTRYRQRLIQQRSSELNRLQKFLEEANIKLSSVVPDIHGQSAREMIGHLIQNDLDSREMANLAGSRLRSKLSELEVALEGVLTDHHRMLFQLSLQMISSYEEAIEKLNGEIDRRMEPYREISERLQTIPGVKKVFRNAHCRNWSGHESISLSCSSLLLGWSQPWES